MNWKDYMTADERAQYRLLGKNMADLKSQITERAKERAKIYDRCRKRMLYDTTARKTGEE